LEDIFDLFGYDGRMRGVDVIIPRVKQGKHDKERGKEKRRGEG